jgi:hypothetical protein
MNVSMKYPISSNNSGHVSSWRFYLHCGIDKTCCPGSICNICHQVFRHPLEHGTSATGKHLLAKAHIIKLKRLTELEVIELTSFRGDEIVLAILKNPGS